MNQLDQFVAALFEQNQEALLLIFYVLIIIGAAIAAIMHKNDTRINRITYFVYGAINIFYISTLPIAMMHSLSEAAYSLGVFWLLSLLMLGLWGVFGFVACRLAIARSLDAFGRKRWAALAFVPLAALVLLFKGPKEGNGIARPSDTIPLLRSPWGVLIGIVIYGLTAFVNVEINRALQAMGV